MVVLLLVMNNNQKAATLTGTSTTAMQLCLDINLSTTSMHTLMAQTMIILYYNINNCKTIINTLMARRQNKQP